MKSMKSWEMHQRLPIEETYEKQKKDSEMIFKQITTANYVTFDEASRAICMFYVPDMTISRAGISHALKRIQDWYNKNTRRSHEIMGDAPKTTGRPTNYGDRKAY